MERPLFSFSNQKNLFLGQECVLYIVVGNVRISGNSHPSRTTWKNHPAFVKIVNTLRARISFELSSVPELISLNMAYLMIHVVLEGSCFKD